jgi:hypothetical protein
MTTFPSNMEGSAIAQIRFEQIDEAIASLDMESLNENSILPLSPADRIQRLVKVYYVVRPLLTAMSMLPLIPASWRAALVLFIETLEALAVVSEGGAVADWFKAGKDLRDKPEME